MSIILEIMTKMGKNGLYMVILKGDNYVENQSIVLEFGTGIAIWVSNIFCYSIRIEILTIFELLSKMSFFDLLTSKKNIFPQFSRGV